MLTFQRFGWMALLLVLTSCSSVPATQDQPVPVQLLQSWSGNYPVAELSRLPDGQRENGLGYISDPQIFAAVWQAFMPNDALPEIDFESELVVFARNVKFYNRTNIVMVNLSNGLLEVIAIETMTAMRIEDQVAMAMAVVPRKGIRQLKLPGGGKLSVR
jgi:hypothetical protein